MFNRLLPRQADNDFQGYTLALWLFGAILLVLAAMSVNSVFNGHYVAVNADGLPLDTYTPAGAQAVVSFYATWGLTQLVIVAFGVIALLRYRALVPLMFLLLLFEQLLLRTVHFFLPVAKPHGVPASWFIICLLSLMALGLVLSLWQRRGKAPTALAPR